MARRKIRAASPGTWDYWIQYWRPYEFASTIRARTMNPLIPTYIARQIKNELKIVLGHILYSSPTRRRLSKLQGCRVNIGCGPLPTLSWINLDVLPFPNVYYWDCRRGLPFADNAVAAIYSEHSFEHLDLETEAKPYLQECRRCLRPVAC